MSEIMKLANVSDQARRSMPLETLIRLFFRASARKMALAHEKTPKSVVKVADRSVKAYFAELGRRLLGIYSEETHELKNDMLSWQKSGVEQKLIDGPAPESK